MRKKIGIGASLAMAVWLLTGCVTFQDSAGKTLASIAQSVDLAMKGWASYVVLGQATPEQEQSVRLAYGQYQSAEAVAEKAYINALNLGDRAGFEKAVEVLRSVQMDLLLLLNQINKKPLPPSP